MKTSNISKRDIDTFGWDLVYLSSLENANKSIAELNTGPTSISQELLAKVGLNTSQKLFKLNADLNPWKFTWVEPNSSSGYIAQCEISFKGKTSTLKEFSEDGENEIKSWNLTGGKTVIQFYLAYYNKTGGHAFNNPDSMGGAQRDLCIRTAGEDPDDLPTLIKNAPFFSVVNSQSTWASCPDIANADEDTQTLLSGFIDQMIKTWLNDSANNKSITQIFASLNVGAVLSKESTSEGSKSLEWMFPSQVDYCIANVINQKTKVVDLEASMIACMTMTKENQVTNWNSAQVDESILQKLSDSSDSALVISRKMVVEHFLLPVVSDFPKNKESVSWLVTDTGDMVINESEVQMGKLPNEDGDFANATIAPNKFSFGVRNDEIHMEMNDITWKWSDDFECKASYNVSYKLDLDKSDSANPKLRVKPGSIDTLSIVVTDIGDETIGILVDVFLGFLGGIFGAALGGATAAKFAARCAARATENGGVAMTYNFAEQLTLRLGEIGGEGAEESILDAAWNSTKRLGVYASETVRAGKFEVNNLIEYCFESKAKALGSLIGIVAGTAFGTVITQSKYTVSELEGDLEKLPNFIPTVRIGLGSIKWPNAPAGSEGFALDQVVLDGAMIIGGKIVKGEGA